jgi:hypothetical protein
LSPFQKKKFWIALEISQLNNCLMHIAQEICVSFGFVINDAFFLHSRAKPSHMIHSGQDASPTASFIWSLTTLMIRNCRLATGVKIDRSTVKYLRGAKYACCI